MQRIFKNQYKRHDIFSCNHSAHHRFGGAVSTYYVLQEKNCYPEGCINFIWRCYLLNKGHACPKKFTHVGKKCFSCKQFYDEKYCQQPELKVTDQQYLQFHRDKEDFDFWINEHNDRPVEIDAKIISIKPDLSIIRDQPPLRFRFNGWILVFAEVYVNYDHFQDTAFAWISKRTQESLEFAIGERFEAEARFNFVRGRLTFNRLHRIDKISSEDIQPPDINRIMVASETASIIPVQPEKCIRCEQGILIENQNLHKNRQGRRRTLVCLQGVKNPSDCLYHLQDELR